MHARSHAEILERVLATARANNPNWQPLVRHRPEVLLQMGHENFVLFERGFAQAFRGEAPYTGVRIAGSGAWEQEREIPAWRYHLQAMAVAPDLFAYLAKFV
jgi:hypothetical protein